MAIAAEQYRHELKYYINYMDYAMLSRRLKHAMPSDAHTDSNGEYFIRSLYFDDLNDAAFREKVAGTHERDKYRIRIYNMSDKTVKLERKHKEGQYIQKQSIRLTRAEFEHLINGNYSFLYEREEPFARSMYIEFKTRSLMPRVIVDYTREPYVFPYEDVRITFDKNIRTAYRSVDLFNAQLPTYPVLEQGEMLIEVKFNRALPSYISMLLQINTPLRAAISKYVLCRKFEL